MNKLCPIRILPTTPPPCASPPRPPPGFSPPHPPGSSSPRTPPGLHPPPPRTCHGSSPGTPPISLSLSGRGSPQIGKPPEPGARTDQKESIEKKSSDIESDKSEYVNEENMMEMSAEELSK